MQLLQKNSMVDRREIISTVLKDHPKELEVYLAAGIICYLIKERSLNGIPQGQPIGDLLAQQVWVLPGSPKLQIAFTQILADPNIQEQKNYIEIYLKKQKLKDKEKDAEEKRRFLLEEFNRNTQRTSQMVENADKWKQMLDPVLFNKKFETSLQSEQQLLDAIKDLEDQLTKIRQDLEKC